MMKTTNDEYIFEDGYNEYIAVKLKEKLKTGKEYCISAYVSPAEGNVYYDHGIFSTTGVTDKLSLGFRETEMFYHTTGLIDSTHLNLVHLFKEDQSLIADTSGWELIQGVYTANGTEQFIYIGRFDPPSQINSQYIGTLNGIVEPNDEGNYDRFTIYYYIDDVSLVELQPAIPLISQTKICKGQNITLSTNGWADELEWVDENTGQTIGTTSSINLNPDISTSYLLRSKLCNTEFEERVNIEVEQIEIKAAIPTISATNICIGQSIVLSTDDWAEELQWVNENTGLTISTTSSFNHSPTENTTYLLRSKLCDTEFEEKISVAVCQTPIAIHNTVTSDNIYLQYYSENRNEPLVLHIFDSRGRLLKQFNLPQGSNSQYPINISELAEGVYHCRVMQGKEVLYYEKIVKLN